MEFTRETYMAAIEHQRKVLQNVGLYVAVQHETYNRRGWSDYMAGVAIKAAHTKVLLHKRAQREGVDVDTGRHLPYSENPGMTRFDFFKESGKWYMTMALDMSPHWDRGIIPHDAVEATLRDAGRWPLSMDVVVLEPYHKNAYPVMLRAQR